MNGAVSNYIAYLFGQNETIKGNMDFNSTLLDLNEFMTETEEPATTDTDSYGVIHLPKNIDFLLRTNLKTVDVMDYKITNAIGEVKVKDGIADLSDVKFNMLGGGFVINGKYNPVDINHPKYDFALKINNLSIKEAASNFSIIKQYAPIAGMAIGSFSADFKINGELTQEMMPNMSTVSGAGLLNIAEAAIAQSKLISGITSVTKLSDTDNVTMKNVLMSMTIKDGKLAVKPFDVKFGSYKTTVAGTTGLDGGIDYSLKMNVPQGKLGSQFQSLIGGNKDPNAEVPLSIGLGGTFLSPKPKLLMDDQKEQVKDAITNTAQEKGKEVIQDALKGTDASSIVDNILGKKDTTKTDSTKTTAPVQDLLKNKDI